MRRTSQARFALLLTAAACCFYSGCKCDPQSSDFVQLELPNALLAYQRTDGIYLRTLGRDDERLLAPGGSYPRFGPDGKKVAFLRDESIMLVSVEDGVEEEIIRTKRGRAVAFQGDGEHLWFTDKGAVRCVHLPSRKVTTVIEGRDARELDVTPDGKRLAVTIRAAVGYRVMAFGMPGGVGRSLGYGCSASISPDGSTVLNNSGSHKVLRFIPWEGGAPVRTVEMHSGRKMDNQFWSNSGNWIVGVLEGEVQSICILDVEKGRWQRVAGDDDCDRPDLFVISE